MNGPLIDDIVTTRPAYEIPWGPLMTASAVIVVIVLVAIAITSMIVSKKLALEIAGAALAITAGVIVLMCAIAWGITKRDNADRKTSVSEAVASLSQEYGVTIMGDSTDLRGFPRSPAEQGHFEILVDGVVLPCTIATSMDRYVVSCEESSGARVLEPR